MSCMSSMSEVLCTLRGVEMEELQGLHHAACTPTRGVQLLSGHMHAAHASHPDTCISRTNTLPQGGAATRALHAAGAQATAVTGGAAATAQPQGLSLGKVAIAVRQAWPCRGWPRPVTGAAHAPSDGAWEQRRHMGGMHEYGAHSRRGSRLRTLGLYHTARCGRARYGERQCIRPSRWQIHRSPPRAPALLRSRGCTTRTRPRQSTPATWASTACRQELGDGGPLPSSQAPGLVCLQPAWHTCGLLLCSCCA
jgi:hypothetical protein